MYFMSSRQLSYVLLVSVAIAVSCWSGYLFFNPSSGEMSATVSPDKPDAYIDSVTVTILNKDGAPALKITAPTMIHYPANDTTRIVSPWLTIWRQSPKPWYINADSATATQGMKQILFQSHVSVRHPGDTSTPATLLTTDSLLVLPGSKQAKSADPVTIVQPNAVMHGTGMLANLDSGTIQLLSNTRGEYVPAS